MPTPIIKIIIWLFEKYAEKYWVEEHCRLADEAEALADENELQREINRKIDDIIFNQ